MTIQELPIPAPPAADVMPVHGIDHLELFVGNAAQAAYYYTHAYGFTETAYRGLETGTRDRVSHVLQQGRIRLVLTGTLTGDDRDRRAPQAPRRRRPFDRPERPRRRRRLRARRGPRRPRPRRRPTSSATSTAPSRLASVATYGETRHVFVERGDYTGRVPARLRGPRHRPHRPRRAAGRDRPRGRQRRARPHGGMGPLLRARVRDDRADPLLRRGDLHRVLGADVEGRHRRLGTDQVPDQRARAGQAQVADRGVPGLLPGRRRPAHRRLDHRHRRAPSPS